MKAGTLRHLLTIEYQRSDQGETGEVHADPKWYRFAKVWGRVAPLTGRELFNAQQVQPDVNTKIELRYLSGLTSAMRVNYDGRIIHIASVLDIEERHAEMHLMCIERK